MPFGNNGLPYALIPADEGHGLGYRKILGMVHGGPGTGEGKRIPMHKTYIGSFIFYKTISSMF